MFQTTNQITEMVRISGKKFSTSTKRLEKSSGEVQVLMIQSSLPAPSLHRQSPGWKGLYGVRLPATVSSNMAGWEIPPTKMEVLHGFTGKKYKTIVGGIFQQAIFYVTRDYVIIKQSTTKHPHRTVGISHVMW